jgi:hypothetical protein
VPILSWIISIELLLIKDGGDVEITAVTGRIPYIQHLFLTTQGRPFSCKLFSSCTDTALFPCSSVWGAAMVAVFLVWWRLRVHVLRIQPTLQLAIH